MGDDLAGLRQQRVRVGGEDRVDPGRELELGRVGLHEADVAPAIALDPTLGLGEHRVGQVDADDPALGTDLPLDQWEVESRATSDLDHAVTRAKPKRSYGPAAVGPLRAERGEERGGDVVVPGPLAVGLDEVLSRTVDLAHGVLGLDVAHEGVLTPAPPPA